ncbi:MAG: N-acetylglucosaminyltransferase [Segetibacter sp.]|jgi:cellulose synthase/poly-beta-1,6-N-acetylglucosamine synthase-like glycosyltransferase|nr:N-acetylglucosaminyltransferase [Segetibacter sp.]
MAVFLLVFIVVLLVCHAVLIETYRKWFLKVKLFDPSPAIKPAIFFTVIIPARNEEDRIGKCLETILQQDYPVHLFEVIVADDYSSDNTAPVVQSLQKQFPHLHLLQLEKVVGSNKLNSYKKKAIELAIQQAKGEWIVTTDADCAVSQHWLFNLANFIQQYNSVFVAAPVKFTNTGSFVSIFQCLDFISLQGITAASVYHGFHSMCNGANLAYKKQVFYEVDGFKGIDKIASGDDMLLMHKIYVRYKKQVHFLLSQPSIVETLPMETWKDFINQRIRWASKADKFDDTRILAVLVFIYLLNLSFLILPFAAIWNRNVWWYWLAMLAAKTVIDLRFMVPVAKFFGEEKLLWWFPVMQPFHIVYTVIAGWLGKFGKYTWKGREVK